MITAVEEKFQLSRKQFDILQQLSEQSDATASIVESVLDSINFDLEMAQENAKRLLDEVEKTQELTRLRKIQQTIIKALEDSEQVFNLIIREGLELIGATKGQLLLVEDDELVTFASTVPGEAEQRVAYRMDNSISGYVVKTNQSVNIPDLEQDEKFGSLYQSGLDEDIVSEMTVPLQYKGGVIGVLNAESDERNAFSESDLELWTILASQAVGSIQISREIASKQKLLEEQELITTIQHNLLTSQGDIPTFLKEMLTRCCELIKADFGHILFTDEKGGGDELLVVESTIPDDINRRISINESVSGIAIKEAGVIRVHDLMEEKRYRDVHQWFAGGTVRSQLVAPLIVEDEVIGTLNVESERPNAFSKGDEDMFSRVSSQLALVLQGEREADRRNSVLEIYQDIVTAGFDLEKIQLTVLDTGVRLLGADSGSLLILNSVLLRNDPQATQAKANKPKTEIDKDDILKVVSAFPLGSTEGNMYSLQECVSGAAIIKKGTINIRNLQEDEEYREIYQSLIDGMKSELVAPLIVDGEIIGAINFESAKEGVFTYHNEFLLQELTNAVALAWSQADLSNRYASLQLQNVESKLSAELLHRLNNPLGAIRQYVLEIEDGSRKVLDAHPQLKADMLVIKTNTLRALELASEVRESGRKARTKQFNIRLVLERAIAHCRENKAAEMSSIEVNIESAEKTVNVTATGRLEQVFIDLISNAVEAMPEGGALTCRVTIDKSERDMQQSQARVDIVDTGHGIPIELQPHIFADWFTSKSGNEFDVAHGIGLWWVRQYLRSIKGEIDFTSKIDVGTTFSVFLPCEQ